MIKTELLLDGPDGLKITHLSKNSYKHKTGNQIMLMPFNTRFKEACTPDLQSFKGIVGECFRISNKRAFDKDFSTDKGSSFKKKIRDYVLNKALIVVETENNEGKEVLENILINLFFEEDGGLIKFNRQVLPYMNFLNEHNQLNEIASFIYDIFLDEDTLNKDSLISSTNDNLFYQLVVKCLPELKPKKYKDRPLKYINIFEEIKESFLLDFKFLASKEDLFLKHLEDLFKYYYFFYISQLAINLQSFGNNTSLKPIYFSMDWETLSESRLSYQYGWKTLAYDFDDLFVHANMLELLNYIKVDGKSIGYYSDINNLWKNLKNEEKEELIENIQEASNFYTQYTGNLNTGENWGKCELQIKEFIHRNKEIYTTPLSIQIVSLFKRIQYQFKNSERKGAYDKYSNWFIRFSKVNFTKTRGRLGTTTVINQELLLFMTKLCVGNEEKIRLNELWEKFKIRGIIFDETSKAEIIKLFERINLLEKKSDSGDAQYVKSII
jgi:DNA phosphorothioation-dependent restriction protein DptG